MNDKSEAVNNEVSWRYSIGSGFHLTTSLYLSVRRDIYFSTNLCRRKKRPENVLCLLFITSFARCTHEKMIAPASENIDLLSVCWTGPFENIIGVK